MSLDAVKNGVQVIRDAGAAAIAFFKESVVWLGRQVVWLAKHFGQLVKSGLDKFCSLIVKIWLLLKPYITNIAEFIKSPVGIFTATVLASALVIKWAISENLEGEENKVQRHVLAILGLALAAFSGSMFPSLFLV